MVCESTCMPLRINRTTSPRTIAPPSVSVLSSETRIDGVVSFVGDVKIRSVGALGEIVSKNCDCTCETAERSLASFTAVAASEIAEIIDKSLETEPTALEITPASDKSSVTPSLAASTISEAILLMTEFALLNAASGSASAEAKATTVTICTAAFCAFKAAAAPSPPVAASAIGSKFDRSVPSERPSAEAIVADADSASLAVPLSTNDCTKVEIGLIVVAPAGAFKGEVFFTPVSILIPPLIIKA